MTLTIEVLDDKHYCVALDAAKQGYENDLSFMNGGSKDSQAKKKGETEFPLRLKCSSCGSSWRNK